MFHHLTGFVYKTEDFSEAFVSLFDFLPCCVCQWGEENTLTHMVKLFDRLQNWIPAISSNYCFSSTEKLSLTIICSLSFWNWSDTCMLQNMDKDCFHHPLVGVFVVEWVFPAEAAYLFLWLSFVFYSMQWGRWGRCEWCFANSELFCTPRSVRLMKSSYSFCFYQGWDGLFVQFLFV